MLSEKRLHEVAHQQVADIEERYPDYHTDLILRLLEILRKQHQGLGQRRRRVEITSIVDAFAQLISEHTENE